MDDSSCRRVSRHVETGRAHGTPCAHITIADRSRRIGCQID